jgi:hypothetical protein
MALRDSGRARLRPSLWVKPARTEARPPRIVKSHLGAEQGIHGARAGHRPSLSLPQWFVAMIRKAMPRCYSQRGTRGEAARTLRVGPTTPSLDDTRITAAGPGGVRNAAVNGRTVVAPGLFVRALSARTASSNWESFLL